MDWQSRMPEGTEQFLAATRIGSTEAGLAVEFREAMSAVTDTGAYQFASVWANVGVESLPFARSVQLWNQRTAEGQGTLGTWGEVLAFNVPLLSGIGEGVYTATSGRDYITGERQSNFARALSGAGAAAEALPFAGSAFRAGRKAAGSIAQASLKASRSTAHALVDAGRYVRSGTRQLSDVTQAASRGFAHGFTHSPARHAIGSNFAPLGEAAYDGLREAAQEARRALQSGGATTGIVFPDWRVGDSITKVLPDGGYPKWFSSSAADKASTVQGRYWMNRAAAAKPGEFTNQQVIQMRAGFAPQAKIVVRKIVDGVPGPETVRTVSKELHHNLRNRGVPGFDEPLHLREVWPWQHELIDELRHTGYEFVRVAD